MAFDLYLAVAALRSDFPALNDIDRAERILEILQNSKISRRTLASALSISEKQIRNLVSVAAAPGFLKQKVRQGTMSTRALLLKAKSLSNKKIEAEKQQQFDNLEQIALVRSQDVISWIKQEKISFAHGEQIVDEARMNIISCQEQGCLPAIGGPVKIPVSEIIEKCRPILAKADFFMYQLGRWLTRWVWYAIGDVNGVLRTLDLAWDVLIAR
jgi:hypothetical protein